MKSSVALCCLALFAMTPLAPFSAHAEIEQPEAQAPDINLLAPQGLPDDEENKIELEFSTYGSVNATRFDQFKNLQDTSTRKRMKTDIERVVLEPELEFYPNIKLETEIEFEHGGTGTTLEYDAVEEAGEFEQEVEAGGEVIIEKIMLQIEDRPWLNYRFGYITVPVGMISHRNHPTEYFTTTRNRAEERILPSTWRETGVSLYGTVADWVHYEVGVFNGLNSEFFRKSSWIKNGQRRLFEDIAADDLAVAMRLDFGRYFKRWLVGTSFYHGDSSGNRRKEDKLTVDANVTIADLHAFYDSSTWSFRAMYMLGFLQNADKVQAANATLSGPADPGAQSPLGSQAEAWFIEVGYNIQKLIRSSKRTDIFARYDSVDPMKTTTGNITRDLRTQEHGWTTGVNWYLRPEIVFKAQYGEFRTGLDQIPTVSEISAGFGWFWSTEG